MIAIRNLTKIYESRAGKVAALDHVSFTLPETGLVFLLGKSGSGKTTLLNLLGGLDAATEGEIIVDGVATGAFREADYDAYRNTFVGFIFQEYNLLENFTVGQNLMLALQLQDKAGNAHAAESEAILSRALEQVDLAGYANRRPGELSGGQKQRVAIARALIKDPRVILADEPTGALDFKTGNQVFQVLRSLSREKLVIVVSHDRSFAQRYGDRIIELVDGRIVNDTDSKQYVPDTLEYAESTVNIPLGHGLAIDDWTDLRQHVQTSREDTAVLVGKEQRTARSSESSGQGVQLIHAKLPLKVAVQMGLQGIRKKKLRLTMVVALCLAAFLLFGISDMFMGYEYRATLVNSLYDHQIPAVGLRKEVYLKYAHTENWYGGDFELTEDDIAAIAAGTGGAAKGVYCPPIVDMSLEKHYYYTSARLTNYGLYAESISGFVDFAQEELAAYGCSLMAGRMPQAQANEIAISRYVAESFVLADYRPYNPRVFICMAEDADALSPDYLEELTWAEYRALDLDALQQEGKTLRFGPGVDQATQPVETPQDMLGRVLLLGSREYTITGIVDTGFDSARYAQVKEQDLEAEIDQADSDYLAYVRASELTNERQYGLLCAAFVAPGETRAIAGLYPDVVTVDQMTLSFKNGITIGAFNASSIARLSDVQTKWMNITWDGEGKTRYRGDARLPVTKGEPRTSLKDAEMIIPRKYAMRTVLFRGKECFEMVEFTPLNAKYPLVTNLYEYPHQAMEAVYHVHANYEDSRTMVNGAGWKVVGRYDAGNPYAALYDLGDTVLVSDAFFDQVTEGRAGIYSYAVVPLSGNKQELRDVVRFSYAETGGIRYPVMSAITYELEALDETVRMLADLFRYVAIGMAAFAALMFWNFISASIQQNKKEIGIMRALGARGRDVFLVFFTESFIVALANLLLGSLLTWLLCLIGNQVIHNVVGILLSLLSFSVRQVLFICILSFAVAFVGSMFPILRIAGKKPVETIRE